MTSGKRRKKGQLSPEDREIWAKVTRTLTPLHPERQVMPDPDDAGLSAPEAEERKRPAKTATAIRTPPAQPKPAPPPPLHTLEHRFRKKLVRGVKPIDGRIDLHGLTQHQAHGRLRHFLHSAQASGHKVVLVITGKGQERGGGGFMDERGVLRRVVPQWLAMPDMRSVVVGYEEAHASHGGSGALYVRIRRKR
ncbi:Smr/MutS family protein [Roseibium aggregatum]|uniref:DNA mismatch repair protein MutS n=1 Tax=Roseibium aggregatum TaxID=187304 RepID=A0A926S4N9_9HYPH|nr:Smr/MutS family protein [Roseibium aggregatum]MBD1546593.1 DNA mismatch repair protein MutS [Roseibium aggregatum]